MTTWGFPVGPDDAAGRSRPRRRGQGRPRDARGVRRAARSRVSTWRRWSRTGAWAARTGAGSSCYRGGKKAGVDPTAYRRRWASPPARRRPDAGAARGAARVRHAERGGARPRGGSGALAARRRRRRALRHRVSRRSAVAHSVHWTRWAPARRSRRWSVSPPLHGDRFLPAAALVEQAAPRRPLLPCTTGRHSHAAQHLPLPQRTADASSRSFAATALARRLASRFVAGETLDTAVGRGARAERPRHRAPASTSWARASRTADEARASRRRWSSRSLERIAAEKLDCNVSVKLTPDGPRPGSGAVRGEHARASWTAGGDLGISVRIDMESSAHTQRTLDLFEKELLPGVRRPGGHRDPVVPAAQRGGHRPPDRRAGAGAAVQGRVPGAGRGGVPRQGGRGPQLRGADRAAARARAPSPRSRRTIRR